MKEVEVKGKRETFKESLEIREVRESFAKDVGEALTKIEGLHKFRKGGIANDVIIRAFQRDNLNVIINSLVCHNTLGEQFILCKGTVYSTLVKILYILDFIEGTY